MSKPPKISGAPGEPPAMNVGKLSELVKSAVPISTRPDEGGAFLHPDTMSVYVVGRHQFALKPDVVKVPLSVWIGVTMSILGHMVLPSLAESERLNVKPAKVE